MIEPTVGRVVWYFKDASQNQPMAAIITHVYNNNCIALIYFHPNFGGFSEVDVELLQTDNMPSPKEITYPYATWMPYQKGQAAKTEQLEKAASANSITYEKTADERDKQAPTTYTFK